MHLVRDKRENLSFHEALQHENIRIKNGWSDIWWYASSSLYADNVKRYIDEFGKSNVKIILFDDFLNNTDKTLKEIFEFLNISSNITINTNKIYNRSGQSKSSLIANFFSKSNIFKSFVKLFIPEKIRIPLRLFILDLNTGKKRRIDKDSEIFLKNFFQEDIHKLEKIINKKTNWI